MMYSTACLQNFAAVFLFFTASAHAASFYVDPDFAGSSDGSASRPWTALGYASTTPQWTAINAALAGGPVTVYFSAREASADVPDEIVGQVNVARSNPANTNRLTLDGMSKYNANDASPSWLDYVGASKMRIRVVANSFSIGWEGNTNRQHYVTMRGFEVTGSTGRITFKGSHVVLEHIWSHDILSTGATIQFNNATDQNCVDYGREQDITIRNNLVERGFGEGIYMGGNYPSRYGGCDTYGPTHDNVLIENNTIRTADTNGGEGDSIDVKVGITNLVIRNNTLEGGPAGNTRGIVVSGLYMITGVKSNVLIEGNRVFNRLGKGIEVGYINGGVIRNNLVYNNGTDPKGIALNGDVSTDAFYNTDVQIYNNTISGAGIGIGDANGITLRNNLILNLPAGSYRFNTWGATNIDSDYNIFPSASIVSSAWVEGAHSIPITDAAAVVRDWRAGNFQPIAQSPAVDHGADLSASGFNYDFVRIVRPQGAAWDIGAYEFTSGDTTAPAAPRELRIQ